jgi:hypothetical protein
MKLKRKVLMFPAVSALVILAVSLFTVLAVQDKVTLTAREKLKGDLAMGRALFNERHPGEWSVRDGKLYKGDAQINDNFATVDQIGTLTGDTVTLFQGTTPVATNVKSAAGKRDMGTRADENIIGGVLKKGGTTIEQADVAGARNETGYEPLRNSKGEVIGIFCVGVPLAPYSQRVKEITYWIVFFSIAGFLIVSFLTLYLMSSITRPIYGVIEGLAVGTEQMSSASGQISQVSQQVAQGAGSQASGIEEVSSSLEEIASMTKQNVSSAEEANGLMSEAGNNITKGKESMKRLRGAIEEIKRSSDETSKIVKTIDGIAFQTNLLALNAAVEAARAGDAGKGFAVVAEEVRNLAQRAGEAARNTATLLEGSIKNADQGVSGWRETAKSLGEMVTIVQKAGERISEITVASKEQAQGIEQVAVAVAQINQVTQANAANAEESASASEELSAQVDQVKVMIQELRALVGSSNGTANGDGRVAEKANQGVKRSPQTRVAPFRKEARKVGGHFAPPPLPSTQRKDKKALGDKRVVPIDPEDVIPFHEGQGKDEEVLRHF